MDDLSTKTVCVVDHGQFQELAIRLARDFKNVLYYKPWKRAAPQFRTLFVGDGFPKVKRIKHLFDVIDDVDLFVFPDVYDGDLQLYLERQGHRVWGSRKSEEFEFRREVFKKTLEEIGLPVPEWHSITGMTALREFLEDNPDWAVKTDLLRGDGETWMADEEPIVTKSLLNAMDAYYDEAKDEMVFIVEKKIESEIEIGYDGISIDGQFTDGLVDYEIKNKCCISAFTKYEDMNENVRFVNDKFGPKLAEKRCRSMFGTEIRVDKEGTPYFIDATQRMPSPPGEIELEIFSNISDVMWRGSTGEFVQVEPEAPFGVQVMLYADWEDLGLLPIVIPDKVRQWVKLSSSCKINNTYYMIQCCGEERVPWLREEVACAVGLGDSIEEAIDKALEHAHEVKGANLEITEYALAEALSRIKEGEKQGIEFTDEPVPEPATIIDNGE